MDISNESSPIQRSQMDCLYDSSESELDIVSDTEDEGRLG